MGLLRSLKAVDVDEARVVVPSLGARHVGIGQSPLPAPG